MKKLFLTALLTLFFSEFLCSQETVTISNPAYRYIANPGFVNIFEINGAIVIPDSVDYGANHYFGVTNIFGFQIDRNFSGGIGVGLHLYDDNPVIPLFLEYRYSRYLRNLTPFVYADGGVLMSLNDMKTGTKIFLNPGIGVSRTISQKIEITLSVGYVVQTRSIESKSQYINFKLGITFRKNSFRMLKA